MGILIFDQEKDKKYIDSQYSMNYNSRQKLGVVVKNSKGQRGAVLLLACQMGLTIIFSIVLAVIFGQLYALSAFLGGMVCIIPNGYFAWNVFRFNGAKAAKKIANSFYKGEAIKFFLTVVLFTLVFKWFDIAPLAFFMTYIMGCLVYWLSPLIFNNKH